MSEIPDFVSELMTQLGEAPGGDMVTPVFVLAVALEGETKVFLYTAVPGDVGRLAVYLSHPAVEFDLLSAIEEFVEGELETTVAETNNDDEGDFGYGFIPVPALEKCGRRILWQNFDQELEIRERIVHALDELDADDVNSARFFLDGLLTDLDATAHDDGPRP